MQKKIKKVVKPLAANPKGFVDYQGYEVFHRYKMLKSITDIYYKYGFDALETPAVETVEALGKFLPDVDRPNEGVFSWLDEEDKWLALRYDLTAPLARFYAQFRNQLPSPYRRFSMGPVWRNEKPGPGRFKQFYQCDADSVGVPNVTADAELCAMLSDILENVGISKNDYVIRINNRKILEGILEKIGLEQENTESSSSLTRGVVMRAIDKLDRLGVSGVKNLLGAGRTDESGDFSKGAGLTSEQTALIIDFISARSISNEITISKLKDIVKGSEIGSEGLAELESMLESVVAKRAHDKKFIIDPTVVRGLSYYTGPVFEAELTFETFDHRGNKRQFGSVAGGGRYDDLIKRFTGQTIPATGVSIGVDRLISAINCCKKSSRKIVGPVVVTVMDKTLTQYYQSLVDELRSNDVRAEMYMGNPKDFGRQLKYADQRNSPVAIIVGSEEIERGVIQLKDLKLGIELSKSIASNEEWKSRPAQFEVSRPNLISAVKKILTRAGE